MSSFKYIFPFFEFNKSSIIDEESISLKIEKGEDIFERGHSLKKVDIDSSFPDYILKNKDKLKKWII
jgi:beta-1,4-mannosyl-glycoprotein beta-1,4-N-acetylglucosaminyltransferase